MVDQPKKSKNQLWKMAVAVGILIVVIIVAFISLWCRVSVPLSERSMGNFTETKCLRADAKFFCFRGPDDLQRFTDVDLVAASHSFEKDRARHKIVVHFAYYPDAWWNPSILGHRIFRRPVVVQAYGPWITGVKQVGVSRRNPDDTDAVLVTADVVSND